ncbi:MAG TPA: nuclease-related domain-containing protein [Actinocrinis sp.]|nr:nuclease-related domain-containing protein [Actinocrinis sp.]
MASSTRWSFRGAAVTAGQVGEPAAGESLHQTFQVRRREWRAQRRRTFLLGAVWWGPGLVLAGIAAGASTRFPAFGLLVTVLGFAAAVNVGLNRPRSLVAIQERATAETATGRILRAVEIRGGAKVLHDRVLTGSAGSFEIEHVVISPRGVFLVDTKLWEGKSVRIFGATMFVDLHDQADMLKEFEERARILGEALTAEAAAHDEVSVVTVTPILAVHHEHLPGTPRVMGGVVVLLPPQLPVVLRGAHMRWQASGVAALIAAAERILVRKSPPQPAARPRPRG